MKYLKVWTNFRSVINPLSDEEKGRLFDMMLNYADTGEEPAGFVGNERYVWGVAKRDIDNAADWNETCRKNGLKGGRPKTKPNQTEPNETEKNPLKPTETQLNPNEPNHNLKEKKRNEKKGNEKKEIMFDRFWIAYPRHEAKQNARKAFDKLNPDEELLAKMLWAIGKQKNSAQWQEEGGRFIPHPASWLNQRRWEDEPAKPVVKVAVQSYEQRDYSNEQEEAMLRMIKGAGA